MRCARFIVSLLEVSLLNTTTGTPFSAICFALCFDDATSLQSSLVEWVCGNLFTFSSPANVFCVCVCVCVCEGERERVVAQVISR